MKFNNKLLQSGLLSTAMVITAISAAATATSVYAQETQNVQAQAADVPAEKNVLENVMPFSQVCKEENVKEAVAKSVKEVAIAENAKKTAKKTAKKLAKQEAAKEEEQEAVKEEKEADSYEAVTENETAIEDNEAAVEDSEVAAEENEGSAELAEESTATEWADKMMPTVEETLNIRTAPSEDAELAGKLHKGCQAQVLEIVDGWTHIISGDVEGYVKNEYCVYAEDAKALAEEQCETYATVMTDGLRIRTEAHTESTIADVLEEGEKITVDIDAEVPEGWVAVSYNEKTAYVSAEYVEVGLDVGEAISMEEVARLAEEEARKAAQEAAQQKASAAAATVQNGAATASTDETTLLAAIIQIEAGGTSYEGQVAVGAVVMNRVRSGSYPNSISGVIYQSGQFATGRLSSVLAGGVSSSCYSAAQAAIGGADNTGGALSFRSASTGHPGTQIGGNVFF